MLAPALLVTWAAAHSRGPSVNAFLVVALIALAVRSHFRAREWHDNETLFTRELAINPDSLPAHEVLAKLAADSGDFPRAFQLYDDTLRFKRDDPRIWFNAGNALLKLNQPVEAAEDYSHAIALEPARADFHYNLGVARAKIWHNREAIEEFRMCLKLNPQHALARKALAQLGENP